MAFLIITVIKICFPNENYVVNKIESDGTTYKIQDASSLHQAKEIMNQHSNPQNNINSEILDSNGKKIAVAYGIIDLRTKKCTVNTSYILDNNKGKGYTNGCYGRDALFLDVNEKADKIKFQLSGVTGWVNAKDVKIIPYLPSTSYNMSYYTVKDQILYHHISMKNKKDPYRLELGMTSLKDGIYYSYDSHYFYNNFYDLSKDVKNSSHKLSVNADKPYYFYYQYVSHSSLSKYSANDINRYIKQSLGFTNEQASLLYQSGTAFIGAQNTYHVNAIMMLSLAINESDYGRSDIARLKNNLFGHAAYDEAPTASANKYNSIKDSIYTHANTFLKQGYLNPKDYRYHGDFFGNKAEGMNVDYASDPYWGEKAAVNYRKFDEQMGSLDKSIGMSKKVK